MKSIKIPLLEAAKWLLVVGLVLFVVLQLSEGRESTTEFSVMEEAVLAQCDLSLMTEADDQMIKRLYGLDPSDYEAVMLYYPLTNMGAEEILLVRLKDKSQQEQVQAAIEARLATQLDSFEGYGVAQTELLQKAVTELRGNYALFVSGSFAPEVLDAFRGGL